MFGIGYTELLIVSLVLLVGLVGSIVVVALIVNGFRPGQGPKNCPHCGKPLR